MKKITATLTAAAMTAAVFSAAMAADDISVYINGEQLDFAKYDNVLPYIENDYTLIPIRAIAENLGLEVDWDSESRTVSVSGGDTLIGLTIDSDKATVNGEEKTLGVPARITDDRTFIPLRFVSENIGAEVLWDGDTRTITITGETKMKELAKIDNTKWQYNEEDNVYWQVGVEYSANPVDTTYETMGLFVPAVYMNASDNGDGTYTCVVDKDAILNGYTAQSAPIVIPVNTPGYSAMNAPTGYTSVKDFTDAGFVYAYAGCRGRNEGAPAGITDLKAAVRYIRFNGDDIAGDKDSIFTFGMSGGGAQSALMGATGNSDLYTPYLNAIGAADEKDDVKGSMCWCPITNLDIADEAYEWNMGVTRTDLTEDMQLLSDGLADAFASYINDIQLTDENGTVLLLEQDEDGKWTKGTYADYVKSEIERSLNNFLSDTTFPYTKQASKGFGGFGGRGGMGGGMPDFANGEKPQGMTGGDNANVPIEELDGIQRTTDTTQTTEEDKTYQTAEEYIADLNGDDAWITYDQKTNTASITSVEAFVKACKNASKSVGAFDDLNASQGENTLFGYGDGKGAHFDSIMAKLLENTEYAEAYNTDLAKLDALGNGVGYRLNMYTPMYYIDDMYDGYKTADVAKYFRIRTGINQGDTALSTEVNLALGLKAYGSDVDFEMVWGQGHTKAERGASGEELSDANFIAWVNECMSK